jgi:hypothetical protein
LKEKIVSFRSVRNRICSADDDDDDNFSFFLKDQLCLKKIFKSN